MNYSDTWTLELYLDSGLSNFVRNNQFKPPHNTFRDCRVALYRRFRESATQAIIFQSFNLFHFDDVLKAEHLRCVKISSGSREGARPPSPPPSIIFRPN